MDRSPCYFLRKCLLIRAKCYEIAQHFAISKVLEICDRYAKPGHKVEQKSRFLAPPIFGDFGKSVLREENRKTSTKMVVFWGPKWGPKNAQKRDHVPRIH